MTPSARIPWGSKLKNFPWSSGLRPRGSRRPGFSRCHSSELYGKAYEDLRLDRCDIDKIRENALYHITPDYSISMLDEWRKDNTNICYLAEATPDNSDYINGLLRMRVVDEIILYTVPFISGTGRHFFKSALPEARWTLSSQKSYSNGVYRSIYTRMESGK